MKSAQFDNCNYKRLKLKRVVLISVFSVPLRFNCICLGSPIALFYGYQHGNPSMAISVPIFCGTHGHPVCFDSMLTRIPSQPPEQISGPVHGEQLIAATSATGPLFFRSRWT